MIKTKLYLFVCLILVSINLLGQRISRAEYIEKYSSLVISEMKRSGIPASIKMAQACLESDDGNSDLAKNGNNHFGIKCHNTWNGDKMYKDDDAKNECFRKYKKAEESFKDHSDFLMNARRYAFLFELKTTDYKGWAKGLKEAGYATNPKYPEMLIKIIEDNKLYELDKGVEIKVEKTEKTVHNNNKGNKGNKANKGNKNISMDITIGGREIKQNNTRNYIVAKAGDSYESLTKEFEKLTWELYSFNDVSKDSVLKAGTWVYLQPKRRKAAYGNDIHIVKAGETLHSISQWYGIKLKILLKRNYIGENQSINTGDTLYLRKNKPLTR